MTKYYQEKLQQGLEYQDFALEQINKMNGMPIFQGAYSSRKYQNQKGESPSGLEIKFDNKFKDTGNLYIEIAEKSDPSNIEFIESGVMRKDNSWLYLIGDYKEAFLFLKKTLIFFCTRFAKYKELRYCETKTSKGVLFPISFVKNFELYVKHLFFIEGEDN